MMMFNVNDYVKVKLTDRGRAIHKATQDALYQAIGSTYVYTPPAEDDEGWSKWQMWSLMSYFGAYTSMGIAPCFDTTIEIVERPCQMPRNDPMAAVRAMCR